jgi:hypothetical protein
MAWGIGKMESYWDEFGQHVLLEDWRIHTNATPYTAPEAILQWLTGRVYGHSRHDDGTFITTTAITSQLPREGAQQYLHVSTRNTNYRLGRLKE